MNTEATGHDRCLRPGCGRKLTNPASRAAGYGPVCRRRIHDAAALVVAKAEQITKAAALIDACRIVPVPNRSAYAATSSNGVDTYYVIDAEVCTCPAGMNARYCYHVAAAQILTASALRRAPRRLTQIGA